MGAGQVKCPSGECDEVLQEREVRELLPADKLQQYHQLSVAGAEAAAGARAFHCKKPDCRGWCVLADEDNPLNALAGDVNEFNCPICKTINCIPCRAIHPNQNCRDYQAELKLRALHDAEAAETQKAFEVSSPFLHLAYTRKVYTHTNQRDLHDDFFRSFLFQTVALHCIFSFRVGHWCAKTVYTV